MNRTKHPMYVARIMSMVALCTLTIGIAHADLEAELDSLLNKEQELEDVKTDITAYESKIYGLQHDITTLEDHIKLLDDSVLITKTTIDAVRVKITRKEEQLTELFKKLAILEATEAEQRKQLLTFVKLLIKQDHLYFSKSSTITQDASLYFGNQHVSDIITRKKYLDTLRTVGENIISEMRDVRSVLEAQKTRLQQEQSDLTKLKNELNYQEEQLASQKQAKESLLADSKGQEEAYQLLLQSRVEEYHAVEREVEALHDNISELKAQFLVATQGQKSLSAEELARRLDVLKQLGTSSSGTLGLSWPVDPIKGISAYYQDSSYKAHFGVAHQAIDIPTPMRTPIRAPADGYVSKTVDNGLGYSYIVVAHSGGVMTLYGHVFQIQVSPGDFVPRGGILGLSGGQPGTNGAGWMTTGAHLHFEVFQDGKHVNPMQYLDNSVLP